MEFAHPWLLLLILPLLAILWYAWKKKTPGIQVPSILPYQMAEGKKARIHLRKLIPFLLYSLAALLLITALARPRKGMEEIRQNTEGIDIMLILDLSGSMDAIDLPETIRTEKQLSQALSSGTLKNRLETAKGEIEKFIKARPNDRIGLIVFADLPYVVCPPTLDHDWLSANLQRLNPGDIGDATEIAAPISSAVQRLKDSEAKSRIAVLFTDGKNTAQAKITPRQAAKLAETFDIRIYTVGIGSHNAVAKVTTPFGISYTPIGSEFDEPLLQDIASTTGGRYYKAEDAAAMQQAMEEIDRLEKTTDEQPLVIHWKELYPGLCCAALGLLLLAFTLRNTVFLSIP